MSPLATFALATTFPFDVECPPPVSRHRPPCLRMLHPAVVLLLDFASLWWGHFQFCIPLCTGIDTNWISAHGFGTLVMDTMPRVRTARKAFVLFLTHSDFKFEFE
jgi:hypothetical protein